MSTRTEPGPDARKAPGIERWTLAAVASLLSGPLLFVTSKAVGAPTALGVVVAVAGALAGAWVSAHRLPPTMDGVLRRHRFAALASLVLAIACVGALDRLSIYMVDPSAIDDSITPSSSFMATHSCMSAYFEAAGFAEAHEENLYEPTLYRGLPPRDPDASKPAGAPKIGNRRIDGFVVDRYIYPSPFLLLPAAVRFLTKDFVHARMLWYVLELVSVIVAMLALARYVGGSRGWAVGILGAAVLLAIPTRATLQFGNFQVVVIAWTVLAMIWFERGHRISAAAILGFMVVAKLYPVMLLVYLFGQRRYRDIAWTVGFCAAYLVLSLLIFGPTPFVAFVRFFPKLMSGEYWWNDPRFIPWRTVMNESVFGFILKLGLIGVPGASSFRVAGMVATLFSVVLALVSFLLGRRGDSTPLGQARVWLALIGLATLRAPYLPQVYGLFAATWLLVVVAASIDFRRRAHVVGLTLGWIALNVLLASEDTHGLAYKLLVTSIPQAVCWGLLFGTVYFALRRRNIAGSAHPA